MMSSEGRMEHQHKIMWVLQQIFATCACLDHPALPCQQLQVWPCYQDHVS